jgi:GH15 family glucan-1,4-alpha-glucosidase
VAGGPIAAPIEDYGLIGDTETAGLVCVDGSIDWLCLPRFDSGACFAALLGDRDNGHWRIAPADPSARARRHYLDDTLVLVTEFACGDGAVRLIDFMPPRVATRIDQHDVVRIVEGVRGRVAMEMDLTIRFDYGSIVPWVTTEGGRLRAVAGPNSIVVDTPVELHGEDHATTASFSVGAGDRVPFALTWSPSHVAVPDPVGAEESLSQTVEWWRQWSSRSTAEGDLRATIGRSLITLKALTYAPTGGIVAAPTTSLPEQLGGVRNWDYRYVWLRDATFTLYALITGGYRAEAARWRDWLLRAVAGSPQDLKIMYGLGGERRLPEMELPWLAGYEGSRPVRVGNDAYRQIQLDTFGEVIDTLWLARRAGLEAEEGVWDLERALLEHLETIWQHDDHGLWEVRGPKRSFTHSRLMSWVAFDRAIKTVEESGLEGPVGRWRAIRDEIRAEIMQRGFDADRNTFVQAYGSDALDAALLLVPQVGFLPPTDPRVEGTVDAVIQELGVDDVLVRRYHHRETDDGLSGGEGAFLICSFWLVDALALLGRMDEARHRFEGLLEIRNDLGLLAEEYDPVQERMLGNFPQAFSHVGLIDSACTIHGELGRSGAAGSGAVP